MTVSAPFSLRDSPAAVLFNHVTHACRSVLTVGNCAVCAERAPCFDQKIGNVCLGCMIHTFGATFDVSDIGALWRFLHEHTDLSEIPPKSDTLALFVINSNINALLCNGAKRIRGEMILSKILDGQYELAGELLRESQRDPALRPYALCTLLQYLRVGSVTPVDKEQFSALINEIAVECDPTNGPIGIGKTARDMFVASIDVCLDVDRVMFALDPFPTKESRYTNMGIFIYELRTAASLLRPLGGSWDIAVADGDEPSTYTL